MLFNCGAGEDSWESLGHKEIKPVNTKGDQLWILIGTTDAKAEAPILCPPEAKNQLIWKKLWCSEKLRAGGERGNRMRWLDGIFNSVDMSFEETWGDCEGQRSLACCSSLGFKESDTTWWLNNSSNYVRAFTTKLLQWYTFSTLRLCSRIKTLISSLLFENACCCCC